MSTELDEALSAMIDGEITEPELLLRALAQPHALDCLRGLVELRAKLQTSAEPSANAVAATSAAIDRARARRPGTTRVLGWAAAAMVLLAIGAAIGVGLAPRPTTPQSPVGPRPPAADLVAEFSFGPSNK